MTQAKVLVSDKLSEGGVAILRQAPDITVDVKTGLTEDQLCEIIGGYDALVIRSATTVTKRVLDAATNLKNIGRAGIGVDNVDVPAASRKGVVVMNTPTGNAVTTAEHAITLIMSMARKIPNAVASMRSGAWEKTKFQGREIAGKNLGVVGLGNIGRIVADRGQGLKMNVIGYDPVMTKERAASIGIELVGLDELFSRADFITVHTPLTPETTNLLNDAAFAKMKDGVMIVNAARGGIVDELALVRAVKAKKVAAAAFDVFLEEPLPKDHPFLGLEEVFCTPHLGASTSEAQERVSLEIADQIVDFLNKGIVKNAVNVPALAPDIAERVGPFLALAEQLGTFVGQLESVDVNEIRVTCTGDASEIGTSPIARSAMAGFLQGYLEQKVNPVSAPFEAQERGIKLVEIKEPATRGYASTVRVSVSGPKGTRTATGAVGSRGEPRLISLEGYEMDAQIEGRMIVMRNLDRPGVIGAVGTVLGKRKINVSRMQLGLDEKSGQALALYGVTAEVPSDALDELRSIENVSSVLVVSV
jgi:D-3-phosphoglycerate dehydrogenase